MIGATANYLLDIGAWAFLIAWLLGICVAGCWSLLDKLLQRRRPTTRYRYLSAHLVALFLLPLISFTGLHHAVSHATIRLANPSSATDIAHGYATIRDVLFEHLPWITVGFLLVWLFGFLRTVLVLIRAKRSLSRLILGPASDELVARVHILAASSGLKRLPRVYYGAVRVPMVFGSWPSKLLLPVEVERDLSGEEFDAIVLHEVAHIERSDFVWNVVQRVMVAALWFHPTSWFLYGRLQREREFCCDWIASRASSVAALSRGLLRLATIKDNPPPSLILSSVFGDLKERIYQLHNEQERPVSRGKLALWFLTALVPGACAIHVIPAAIESHLLKQAYMLTPFSPTVSIIARDDAGPFAVTLHQGQVVALKFGDVPVPHDRIVQTGREVKVENPSAHQALILQVAPEGVMTWQSRSLEAKSR